MTTITIAVRDALKLLPEVAAHSAGSAPDLRSIYTAASHGVALDPTREIVVGDRGVGKSFWAATLADNYARTQVSAYYPDYHLENVEAHIGFSEQISNPNHPSTRAISELIRNKIEPSHIWRAVVFQAISGTQLGSEWNNKSWYEKCEWISNNSHTEEELLLSANQRLKENNRSKLILFDALDRLGRDWSTIRLMVRALLETALEMRSFSQIKMKIFIRPDMDGDRKIWSIRDGSKLKQNQVNLIWSISDLYGYLWHWLLHSEASRDTFISAVWDICKIRVEPPVGEQIVPVPPTLMGDEKVQRVLFELFAGKAMGAGARKGHPYTWIPKHLADAKGRVSLRSFIVALRDAARNTPLNASTALTHEPIKRGVQQASLVRVNQLKEDYFWIEDVLSALSGLRTPNAKREFVGCWEREKSLEKIMQQSSQNEEYLIPAEFENHHGVSEETYDRLISALRNIGVVEVRNDNRLNIPDLFQVASGMLRKGGVRPIK